MLTANDNIDNQGRWQMGVEQSAQVLCMWVYVQCVHVTM